MSSTRYPFIVLNLLLAATGAVAATPKEIDAAVQKGAGYLKEQFTGVKPADMATGTEGIGPAALAGLALLEAGTPIDDKALKAITAGVREAAFSATQTYQIALCILYLDRLGDPGDVPLIQMLAVRLLAGQNSHGGWTYSCIDSVPPADEARLRASLMVTELKAGGNTPAPGGQPAANTNPPPAKPAAAGKLDAEVEKYATKLASIRRREHGDDNSNTQFGVLGIWVARKHGVPVEAALELIERRFLATQVPAGGWPYSGPVQGSPSMTCAGLIGLATAVGRREERRLKADVPVKPEPKAKPGDTAKPPAKSDDPFFNPPPTKPDDPFFEPGKTPPAEPKPKNPAPPNANKPKHPADARDAAIEKALASLASVLGGDAPVGKGKGANAKALHVFSANGQLGDRDFYFLWSLERVGVIFGIDKIGNIDWYAAGAEELLNNQHAGGDWGRGARGNVVDTSFALLFLSRSNLVRDLSAKVQRDPWNTELRAGTGTAPREPDPAPAPMPKQPATSTPPPVILPTPIPPPTPNPIPVPVAADAKTLAADLASASDADWEKMLAKLRDEKGTAYTQALLIAAGKLDGERKKAARDALAERLTRMTADTLRTMVKDKDAELRRAAVLAMAMKDDKAHIADLVVALNDDEEMVIRAARAGLKSLAGEDFGPAPGATAAERAAAIRAWGEWIKKQKR